MHKMHKLCSGLWFWGLYVHSLSVAFSSLVFVKLNSQVSVFLHHLYLIYQDWNIVWFIPGAHIIHCIFLCFVHIQIEVIVPTQYHKVVDQLPVHSLLSITDTPHSCIDIWVLLEMAGQCLVLEVWSAQQRNCENTLPYGRPMLLTTFSDTHSHKLWSVCLVTNNPGGCGGFHLYFLKLVTEQYRLNCIKSTEEIILIMLSRWKWDAGKAVKTSMTEVQGDIMEVWQENWRRSEVVKTM